jgi:hypothetical protein
MYQYNMLDACFATLYQPYELCLMVRIPGLWMVGVDNKFGMSCFPW